MDRVALHHGEYPLLPGGQALAVVATDHRFMADIISDVAEVDRAAQRFAGGEKFGNVGTLHETESRFRAPEIWRYLLDCNPVAGADPRHRQDFDAQYEQMLMQGTVVPDMPEHHRRRIFLGPGQEHGGAGNAGNVPGLNILHEFRDRD